MKENLIVSNSDSVVDTQTTLTTASGTTDKSFKLDVSPKWQHSTQVIDGVLMFVGKYEKSRRLAIKCTDEKPDAAGKIQLRGITLTPSASIDFNYHYNRDLFERQRIAVLVASEDSLETDLDEGKGFLDNPPLFGVDFTFRRLNTGM